MITPTISKVIFVFLLLFSWTTAGKTVEDSIISLENPEVTIFGSSLSTDDFEDWRR